jgi:hypothetical protein
MKKIRILGILLALGVFLGAFAPFSNADEWDKTTKVKFSEPVQVPGTVLPVGTYVFRLQDSSSNRHIVQIYNEDHTKLITTVLAIPNARLQPTGKTVLTYDERPADQPVALAAWFYPGDNFGQEFAYPKSEAEQLSRLNKREVPSLESDEGGPTLQARSNESASQTATQTPPAQTPQTQPPATSPTPAPSNPPSAAVNPTPPAPAPNPPAATTEMAQQQKQELPHTASFLSLVGLLGFLSMGFAAVIRAMLRA